MGCGCVKVQEVEDPQVKRDQELARRLQKEEERNARAAGGQAGGSGGTNVLPYRNEPNWSNAGAGHTLGGDSKDDLSAAEKRQRALEAAEKRQNTVPGLSQEKAAEMREKQMKDELLGKIQEFYNARKLDMPMGMNAATATSAQLKKHWDAIRKGESPEALVLGN
mmetsp:Transcript_128226/g.208911  ORF Transcript_128226/g.208911 Transcript_128226/m.208911 type:complete len:165 (+) Transcript_128226:112-606(+)